MDVRLAPLDASQRQLLANLFELYAHDFSEHVPLTLSERVSASDPTWRVFRCPPRAG